MRFNGLYTAKSLPLLQLLVLTLTPGIAGGQETPAAFELRSVDGMPTRLQIELAETGEPNFVAVDAPGTTLASVLSSTCGTQPPAVQQALIEEGLRLNGLKTAADVIDVNVTVAIPFCLPIKRSTEVVVAEGDTVEGLLRKHTGVFGRLTLNKTIALNSAKVTGRGREGFFRNLTVGDTIKLPYEAGSRVFVPRTSQTDFKKLVRDLSPPSIAAAIETTATAANRPALADENAYNLVESVQIASVGGDTPCQAAEDLPEPIDMTALKALFDYEAGLLSSSGRALRTTNIGIIDTGLASAEDAFFSESVLMANFHETNGTDGIDDRPKNGAVDDYFGVNLNSSPLTGYIEPYAAVRGPSWQYHGTRMASLLLGGPHIVAQWGGTRPPLKIRIVNFASSSPSGGMVSPSLLTTAIDQLQSDGVEIINISLSSKTNHSGTKQYFSGKTDMLYVVAAGNKQGGGGDNLLISGQYPARYGGFTAENVLTVAAHGRSGKRAHFSHYAKEFVDLLAPGCGVQTRNGDGQTTVDTGTSPATALVSFTSGLLMSLGLDSPKAVKTRILASVDHDEQLASESWTGGRLNAVKALSLSRDVVETTDNRLHYGKTVDRDALLALCADGVANFSDVSEIYKVVPNISTPSGLKIDYWADSDGILAAQRCVQRDASGRKLTLDDVGIQLSEVRDVVFRWQ